MRFTGFFLVILFVWTIIIPIIIISLFVYKINLEFVISKLINYRRKT